ncbi:MAG: Cna B-type domain-containing protein [Erysipelotrichales bacterium]
MSNIKCVRSIKFLLLFVVLFSVVNGVFFASKVDAQNSVISSVVFENKDISHNEKVKVIVSIGGNNTHVTNNQRAEVVFNGDNAIFNYPRKPISLLDGNNKSLGEVTFVNNKAIITFNEYAQSLDSIEGGFSFYAQGSYTGDKSKPGVGSISVENNGRKETLQVNYNVGGQGTDNLYSKKGVSDSENPTKVDWVFTINAAKKAIKYPNERVSYTINDTLPNTMEWDNDDNNNKSYVVEVSGSGYMAQLHGGWHDLKYGIEKLGLKISVNGQDLNIEVPANFNYGGGWIAPLDKTTITIRLSARIKDDVLKDDSIEYVKNTSKVEIKSTNNDWKINPSDLSDSAKIYRQKGWGQGTKPGEIEILKLIKDSEIGVPNVKFNLWRSDNLEIKDDKKVLELVSDNNGYIKVSNLPIGEYHLKEISAPSFLNVDTNEKLINIKRGDTKGESLKIYNEKRKIDLKAQKIWHNDIDDNQDTSFILERKVNDANEYIVLNDQVRDLDSKNKVVYWNDMDLFDNNGNEYQYRVKEINEKNGTWLSKDDLKYNVKYNGNQDEGFIIVNTKKTPLINLEPPTIDIDVTKEWVGIDKDKAQEVKVFLVKNYVKTEEYILLNRDNNWQGKFLKLKIKENIKDSFSNEYSLIEESIPGFTSSIDKKSDTNYIITNTKVKEHRPIIKGKRDISVIKEWLDLNNNPINNIKASISVELYKNNEATNKIIELNNENSWKSSISNLDKYDENNNLIEYSFKEVGDTGFVVVDDIYYDVIYSGDMDSGFVVTNKVAEMIAPINPSSKPKPSNPNDNNSKPKENDEFRNKVKVKNKHKSKINNVEENIAKAGLDNKLELILGMITLLIPLYLFNKRRV